MLHVGVEGLIGVRVADVAVHQILVLRPDLDRVHRRGTSGSGFATQVSGLKVRDEVIDGLLDPLHLFLLVGIAIRRLALQIHQHLVLQEVRHDPFVVGINFRNWNECQSAKTFQESGKHL